jgi:hypothetical protein
MTDLGDNVVAHPTAARAGQEQPARLEALRVALGQLDELGDRLQRISPQSNWTAQRWMIASTPFRMRLVGAHRRLDDLAQVDALGEHDPIRWTLELGQARYKAEKQLHDITSCLNVLHRVDASPAERVRETEIFAAITSELLKALKGSYSA